MMPCFILRWVQKFEMFYQWLKVTPRGSLKVIEESPIEKEHVHKK